MNDQELQDQFGLCQKWQDAEQWDLLALAYYARGYLLNALHCFKQADACRVVVETEMV
jgi:cytochrome c-type biogenesis protein CcmH/NrfG